MLHGGKKPHLQYNTCLNAKTFDFSINKIVSITSTSSHICTVCFTSDRDLRVWELWALRDGEHVLNRISFASGPLWLFFLWLKFGKHWCLPWSVLTFAASASFTSTALIDCVMQENQCQQFCYQWFIHIYLSQVVHSFFGVLIVKITRRSIIFVSGRRTWY